MTTKNIALFENYSIRRAWHNGEWWFSVVDIIKILSQSTDPKRYWSDLKRKLVSEGFTEVYEKIVRLKIVAVDGRLRETDMANIKIIFRIIQSIPSPKAEPFKCWLAKVGHERLEEIRNPALAIERMKSIYEQKGYPKEWIEKRMRSVAIRQNLTNEWDKRGANDHKAYAILTNEIMSGTFGMTAPKYKDFKGIANQNLRDHMNDIELILTMLAEATTTELHKTRDSIGFRKLHIDTHDGGKITGRTRKDIEKQTKKPVPSKGNFLKLNGQ